MDHFRNDRSVSFSTFDWSNHLFRLIVSPRFENLGETIGRSPTTLFHVQSGSFSSFDDLDTASRISLDLGPGEVTNFKEMMSNFPASSREGVSGMILFVIDLGEFGRIVANYPIASNLAVGAAFDTSSEGPSELLILQTIVDRGIKMRFNLERGWNTFHRMVPTQPGWKWQPLSQEEEEELKSDQGLRKVLYWF